jgi:hypothetical protein
MSENLSRFVDDDVIRIIRTSQIYKHLKKSKDENFADVTLGTCSANVLCYLKNKYRKKYLFTQKTLCDIIVIAAKQILIQDGIVRKLDQINT